MRQICLLFDSPQALFQDSTAELYHNSIGTVKEILPFIVLDEFMTRSEDKIRDTSVLVPLMFLLQCKHLAVLSVILVFKVFSIQPDCTV